MYIRFKTNDQAVKHRGDGTGRIAIDAAGLVHVFSSDFSTAEIYLDWSMSTILTDQRQLSWPVKAGNESSWIRACLDDEITKRSLFLQPSEKDSL